jgi:redox-sensitive bicupin YhaK (pirin superfamily)
MITAYDLLVSNLEKDPPEVGAAEVNALATAGDVILEPRDVPLGGPRAMTVRRTLPQRRRSLIGPWCFVDHYGPDSVATVGGMSVPPHPHTGLQTVSWLFQGEIEHRDSVGSHAMVRPGELNLMTAGRGIQHSEVSTASTAVLHGAQLWVALPEASRGIAPFFEHHVPEAVRFDEATLRVFLGTLAGVTSNATAFSPIVGAQIDLPPGASIELPVEVAFEHGLLLDQGSVAIEGVDLPVSHLSFREVGATSIRLLAGEAGARLLLIGGAPFGESIVMWWNFIGRSHDEIVRFRAEWQTDVIARENLEGPFGSIGDGRALPAPELPAVRLKPRD